MWAPSTAAGFIITKEADRAILQQVIDTEQEKYETPIQTELRPLSNYYLAEEYHQDYLEKNPVGYCHVDFSTLADFDKTRYAVRLQEAVGRGKSGRSSPMSSTG